MALFSLKLFFSFKKLTILFPKLEVLFLPCILPPALRLHSIPNVTTKDIGADGTFHLTALFQILRYITSNSAVRIDIFKQKLNMIKRSVSKHLVTPFDILLGVSYMLIPVMAKIQCETIVSPVWFKILGNLD